MFSVKRSNLLSQRLPLWVGLFLLVSLTFTNLFAQSGEPMFVFEKADLIQMIKDDQAVTKIDQGSVDKNGTPASITLTKSKLLKHGKKLYWDEASKTIRLQLDSAPAARDPEIERISSGVEMKRVRYGFSEDIDPDGHYFSRKIKLKSGQEMPITLKISLRAGKDRAQVEREIRLALEKQGYTIGADGYLYYNGEKTDTKLSDLVDWIINERSGWDGDDSDSSRDSRKGRRVTIRTDRDGNGPGDDSSSSDITISRDGSGEPGSYRRRIELFLKSRGRGPGSGSNSDLEIDIDRSGPGGGDRSQSRRITVSRDSDGGRGGSRSGYEVEIINEATGRSEKITYTDADFVDPKFFTDKSGNESFRIGDFKYRIQRIKLPEPHDEWVILRETDNGEFILIKDKEHAMIIDILESIASGKKLDGVDMTADQAKKLLSRMKDRGSKPGVYGYDSSDYANVRKYAMKRPSSNSDTTVSRDSDTSISRDSSTTIRRTRDRSGDGNGGRDSSLTISITNRGADDQADDALSSLEIFLRKNPKATDAEILAELEKNPKFKGRYKIRRNSKGDLELVLADGQPGAGTTVITITNGDGSDLDGDSSSRSTTRRSSDRTGGRTGDRSLELEGSIRKRAPRYQAEIVAFGTEQFRTFKIRIPVGNFEYKYLEIDAKDVESNGKGGWIIKNQDALDRIKQQIADLEKEFGIKIDISLLTTAPSGSETNESDKSGDDARSHRSYRERVEAILRSAQATDAVRISGNLTVKVVGEDGVTKQSDTIPLGGEKTFKDPKKAQEFMDALKGLYDGSGS